MIFYELFFFDLAEEIQDLLRTSDRKGRNHHVTATVKGRLQNFRQLLNVIRTLFGVKPVSIGGFHDNIISFLRIRRILNERLVFISNVSGKDNFLRYVFFRCPDLNTGRSQEMTYICKTDLHPFTNLNHPVVLAGNNPSDDIICVLHGIKRLDQRIVRASLRLTVLPLRILHLDMCAVPKHNTAKICRCFRCQDLPPESSCCELWQHTGMIHMGMGKQHIIKLCLTHGQLCILKGINALLHTIIHQNMFVSDL